MSLECGSKSSLCGGPFYRADHYYTDSCLALCLGSFSSFLVGSKLSYLASGSCVLYTLHKKVKDIKYP